MTYIYLKKIINNTPITEETKTSLLNKMDVFLLNDRITEAQYNELIALLDNKE